MRRISVVLVVILIFGCAGSRSQQEPEGNFIKVAKIGVSSETINNELVVTKLIEDFPAKLAGVKSGDIIVSIDGKIITTKKEFTYLMNNKQLGDYVILVTKRNGQQISFDIEPRIINERPTLLKLQNILFGNSKVTVAVIVTEVKNSFPNMPQDWATSTRNNLQSREEMHLLSGFGKNEKFSIVDRSRLKQILDEFQFSRTGFVSDKLRAKIGEMTGATHILDISFSRFQGRSYEQDDILNVRLIEIESGKVLAVDQITTH